MKKLIPILLTFILLLSACQSRDAVPSLDPPPDELTMDHLDDVEELEEEQSDPEPAHDINDPEEISQGISIVEHLLDRGEKCDLLSTGDLPLLTDEPPQVFDEDEYHLVKSDLRTKEDVENFWKDTFVMEGHAQKIYEDMQDSHMYINVNGALHVKDLQNDLPPLTTGEWDLSTLRILSFTEDALTVEMDTLLVGQPHGMQTLKIIKQDDVWLLSDSYFLD